MQTMKYESREARDGAYRTLGGRRRTIRGAVLSPDYVVDADLDQASTNGFGGYEPQLYPVLYVLEVR